MPTAKELRNKKLFRKRLLKIIFNESETLKNNFKYAQEDFRRLKAIRPQYKTLKDFKEFHDFKIKIFVLLFLQESDSKVRNIVDFLSIRRNHFDPHDKILIEIIITRLEEPYLVNKIVTFLLTKFLEEALFYDITFTGKLTHDYLFSDSE